jgi:hypothetical protein
MGNRRGDHLSDVVLSRYITRSQIYSDPTRGEIEDHLALCIHCQQRKVATGKKLGPDGKDHVPFFPAGKRELLWGK